MKVDDRGKGAAAALHDELAVVSVPDTKRIVRRARGRRATYALVGAAAVVALGLGTTAIAATRHSTSSVRTGTSSVPGLPAGAVTQQGWTVVPTASAGIGEDATFQTIASDGATVVLGGSRGRREAMSAAIWYSTDGIHWRESRHPSLAGSVSAIASGDGVTLAIGSTGARFPAGGATFVWRSGDGGRTWRSLARGSRLFGAPAPQMGRPFVTQLARDRGRWVAAGGGSDGYAAIWVSQDGARWRQVLDGYGAGGATIVRTTDGSLLAYWVNLAWFAHDPSAWSRATDVSVPKPYYPANVAAGAALALGENLDRDGQPTPLMRSDDQGRTWRVDPSLLDAFPHAAGQVIAHVDGTWVVAGATRATGAPDDQVADAWVSPDTGTWRTMPSSLRGPGNSYLALVAPVGSRLVLAGPVLDRIYVLDAAAVRTR